MPFHLSWICLSIILMYVLLYLTHSNYSSSSISTPTVTYRHYAEPRHSTEAIAAGAIEAMGRHNASLALSAPERLDGASLDAQQSPLFLYVAFTAAHSPLQPLPRHIAKCEHIAHLWRRQFCGLVVGLDEAVHNVSEVFLCFKLYAMCHIILYIFDL
jgi:hypothetical protein